VESSKQGRSNLVRCRSGRHLRGLCNERVLIVFIFVYAQVKSVYLICDKSRRWALYTVPVSVACKSAKQSELHLTPVHILRVFFGGVYCIRGAVGDRYTGTENIITCVKYCTSTVIFTVKYRTVPALS